MPNETSSFLSSQSDISYLEGSEQQVKLTWFDVDRQPADKERSYLEKGNA